MRAGAGGTMRAGTGAGAGGAMRAGSGAGGALAGVKRLLTSRAASDQLRATNFIAESIQRSKEGSTERQKITQFLLEGDLCVFLCEAMGSLDWGLVRGIIDCCKLLSNNKSFFEEHHWSCVVASTIRTVTFYVQKHNNETAVDFCLHFIADILNSVRHHKQPSILSSSTVYNTDQLIQMLNYLADYTGTRNNTSLAVGLVLHAIINYQPEDLVVNVKYLEGLAAVLRKWFPLLIGILGDLRSIIDTENNVEMFYGLICHLGMDTLRLCHLITYQKKKRNFIQKIITSDDDILNMKKHTVHIARSVYLSMLEIITHTKENYGHLNNENYALFLQFLKMFLSESVNAAVIPNFSELLASIGYLRILPKSRLLRNDNKINTLTANTLGVILSQLSRNCFGISCVPQQPGKYSIYMNNLQSDLGELHDDVEKWPQSLNVQLCKNKPYSLLIYLYFYLMSCERPEIPSAALLPYLVQHIAGLPPSSEPPKHIIKCLWLVFAMACISNTGWKSFNEKIQLEKALGKLVRMIESEPTAYYTHHPSILLWSFMSDRISRDIQYCTLSLWLEKKSSLPDEISTHPTVLSLLLDIMIIGESRDTILNTCAILKQCMLKEPDGSQAERFGGMVWAAVPDALHNLLVSYEVQKGVNLRCLVELAIEIKPENIDPAVYQKTATLITLVFHKMYTQHDADDEVNELNYYCLKLAYHVLQISKKKNDNTALMGFVGRIRFLTSVLAATTSADDNFSCMALQLLSTIMYDFANSDCRCNTFLDLELSAIVATLHKEQNNARGHAFQQLFYAIVSNASHEKPLPIIIVETGPSNVESKNAFRALLFRIQMICCKESREKSEIGWKILIKTSKYIVHYKSYIETITMFATQPWMFTLVRFQLTQRITPDFLTFLKDWLSILKVILQNNIAISSYADCFVKRSLFLKTFLHIQKCLNSKIDGSQRSQTVDNILQVVDEFLNEKNNL